MLYTLNAMANLFALKVMGKHYVYGYGKFICAKRYAQVVMPMRYYLWAMHIH